MPGSHLRSLAAVAALTVSASGCAARGAAPGDGAPAPPGLVTMQSRNDVARTVALLDSALTARGIRIVARVDHDAAAAQAGQTLRPTRLLIAGNPAVGTPLMASAQSAGIDLPLKFLVWQDATGRVFLSYNDQRWVAERHGIRDQDALVERMSTALRDVARLATGGGTDR